MASRIAPLRAILRELAADLPFGEPTSWIAYVRTARRFAERVAPRSALRRGLRVDAQGPFDVDAGAARFTARGPRANLRLTGTALRSLRGRGAELRFRFDGPVDAGFALHFDLGAGLEPTPGIRLKVTRGVCRMRFQLPAPTRALVVLPPPDVSFTFRDPTLTLAPGRVPKNPTLLAVRGLDLAGGLSATAGLGFRAGRDATLVSTTCDPQLEMVRPPLHAGFYMLELKETFESSHGVARVYPDLGMGFREEDAIAVPLRSGKLTKRVVHFPRPPRRVRFDPLERQGAFELQQFSFVPITARFARERMLAKLPQGQRAEAALADDAVLYANYDASLRARGEEVVDYDTFLAVIEPRLRPTREALLGTLAQVANPPTISVVMPTYASDPRLLREAIDSVLAQSYPHWQLCVADDASEGGEVAEVLAEYAGREPRVQFVVRAENGHIAAATNSALELATGEFVAFLDHDDTLDPDALLLVAEAIVRHPGVGLVYTDEDKLDEEGRRFEPHWKPDLNRELLLGFNYVSHLGVYRRSLVEAVGRMRSGFDGAQDYDLLLRCLEQLRDHQVVHLPYALYHWRTARTSTAGGDQAKAYTTAAGIRVLREHLERRGMRAEVSSPRPNFYRVRHARPVPPPLVSLVIPTRDGEAHLRTCIRSILERTVYPSYEILVVDNQSREARTLAYLDELRTDPRVRVLRYDHPFNFSAINNFAVAEARGSVIGLVNDDVEVIGGDWLDEMVALAAQPDIGCVGAKLYYPDGTLQHGGVILGLGGVAGHSHKHFPRHHPGYFGRLLVAQDLSAVTAACLVVRREVYDLVGGLDANTFAVAFNDVDFCLRVRQAGYRNVFTPWAELFHHESKTRGSDEDPSRRARFAAEIEAMKQRWGDTLRTDPAYSPNLTRAREDFSLRGS